MINKWLNCWVFCPHIVRKRKCCPRRRCIRREPRIVRGRCLARTDGRLYAPRLCAFGRAGRLWWLVLPMPRFALRHIRSYSQRSCAAQPSCSCCVIRRPNNNSTRLRRATHVRYSPRPLRAEVELCQRCRVPSSYHWLVVHNNHGAYAKEP